MNASLKKENSTMSANGGLIRHGEAWILHRKKRLKKDVLVYGDTHYESEHVISIVLRKDKLWT